MALSLSNLRAISDDDLVALHDETAQSTSVGVNYYLDEMSADTASA